MTRRAVTYISKQFLIGLMALQILNLSVGSPANADTYDYSYTYNKSYDPTETAVEWIVELEYGQKPEFSYTQHAETGKGASKSMHWKTDLQKVIFEPLFVARLLIQHPERPSCSLPSQPQETFSPPPEDARA